MKTLSSFFTFFACSSVIQCDAFLSNPVARRSPSKVLLAAESDKEDSSAAANSDAGVAPEKTESSTPPRSSNSLANNNAGDTSFLSGLQESLQMRLRIAQESKQQGYDVKQTLANVLAGEYDQEAVNAQIDAEIQSAACVMYTWERSPSCVKAIEAFEVMNILDQVKVIRLDDPWEEGNPVRAELGKRLGRSSVPIIFIGGEYVGGFDGGVSAKAPGIQSMAFQGTLRPALEAAGIEFAKQ